MRRTVRKHRQDELYSFAVQRAQIDVDGIELTFIHFAPLPERFHGTVPDLILETENHVAVVGFVQTANRCLEAVTGLDSECRVLAADHAIIASFRIGQQRISLCFAILQPRRVKHYDEALVVSFCPWAGESARIVFPARFTIAGKEIVACDRLTGHIDIHVEV